MTMTQYLFVYGTLMSASGHPMGVRLAREAWHLGPASMPGRLYDLGKWPGLVDSALPGDRVHGEVYALPSPEDSFRWLDAYEGIAPGIAVSEYARVQRRVTLEGGLEVNAWIYLYQWDLEQARPLPEGRWRPSHRDAALTPHTL